MPEHFTKNTVEARLWCKKCFAFTMHLVNNGHRGPCQVCMSKIRPQEKAKDSLPVQLSFRF